MTQTIGVSLDTSGLTFGLSAAAKTFDDKFAKPVAESADVLSSAFHRVFADIESTFARAARTGQFSMKQMVDAILADLSRLAFQKFVEKPIANLVEGIFGKLFDFGGGRATGGPVSGGASYLVGETGPELFTPAGTGQIAPASSPRAAPVINFHITTADADSFRRSEAQVTAMLARAVQRGTRGM